MILYKNTSKVLYNYSMCMGGYVKDPSMGCVHLLNGMAIYLCALLFVTNCATNLICSLCLSVSCL